MSQPVRTRAIVLRRTNYGEADRILQVITPDGRRSAIARGSRREKSKLAGGIELFAVSDVVIHQGRGELGILSSARLINFYHNILSDYERMSAGYDAIKLVARASETIDAPQWYEILSEVLAALDNLSISLLLIQTWLYIRYAAMMGHELSLVYDINGDRLEAQKSYQYDISEKGLRPIEGGELSSDHIKLLRLIAAKSIKTLTQISGTDSTLPICFTVARQHVAV